MKYIHIRTWLALLTVSALTLSTSATSSLQNLQSGLSGPEIRYTLKIPVKSAFEMARYTKWLERNGYDVAGYSWRRGEIEVITDMAGIEKLNQNHYQGSVDPHEADTLAIDSRFMNPNKVEQKLKELNARYPQYTRLEQIGTSLQGRGIWALLVSATPNEAGSKPSIIFDGMHHAREIMTPEIAIDAAELALTSLETGTELAPLFGRWDVWVVPMLNVDGNNIVWTQKNMWRKNARGENGSTWGVDINRNYPFNWKKCNGASDSKFNDAYRGTAGASEPETRAMMNLAEQVIPTGSLSYHSYSELVLYPYGCNGVLTGDNALVSTIATELAGMLPSDRGGGNYDAGPPWQLLYDVDGDSMSYLHGEFGTLAITFEVNQSFQPSYDLRAPTVAKHRKAYLHFMNRMDQNLLTLKVLDARTGAPAAAVIGISNLQLVQGEKPFRTNAAGNFFKVLNPGSYTLTVQLADGRVQTLMIRMDGPQTQTVVFN